MKEDWRVQNKKGDFPLICQEFGIGEPTARLLVNRGVTEIGQIRKFLYPELGDLADSRLLPDAELFCRYVEESILLGRRIRVFGDYDVDGVCGTYVLVKGLKKLGAVVDYCIPHRRRDGYGISDAMMEDAIRAGIEVVVTVDNGIAGHKQVERAKNAGMIVLITDHHEPGDTLPGADVICDPKRKDSEYPEEICGTVVAAKLMELLYSRNSMGSFICGNLDVMALATVCDIMKLVGENRVIVKLGLEQLRNGQNPGLKTLMDTCRIVPEKLNVFHLGFVLGPCVNAAGRLDHAKKGAQLLLSTDKEEMKALAEELVELNSVRKEKTNQMVLKALEMLKEMPKLPDYAIVLYLPECDESLAGIVAGKVREACYRPAIILTDSDDEEMLKGSARSIENVSIFEMLKKCEDLLEKYGGHEQAAGLSLRKENYERFCERIKSVGWIPEEFRVCRRIIDIVLPFRYLTKEMIQEVSLLEPFGNANPKPLYGRSDCLVTHMSLFGNASTFIKLQLTEDGNVYEGKYFGNATVFMDEMKAAYGEDIIRLLMQKKTTIHMKIIYTAKWTEFRSCEYPEIQIENYRFVPEALTAKNG